MLIIRERTLGGETGLLVLALFAKACGLSLDGCKFSLISGEGVEHTDPGVSELSRCCISRPRLFTPLTDKSLLVPEELPFDCSDGRRMFGLGILWVFTTPCMPVGRSCDTLGDNSRDLLGALRRSGVCLSNGVDKGGSNIGSSGATMWTSGGSGTAVVFNDTLRVRGGVSSA